MLSDVNVPAGKLPRLAQCHTLQQGRRGHSLPQPVLDATIGHLQLEAQIGGYEGS